MRGVWEDVTDPLEIAEARARPHDKVELGDDNLVQRVNAIGGVGHVWIDGVLGLDAHLHVQMEQ